MEVNLKILIANKYLYPRGGDCLYTLRLMDLLLRKGHQVYPFSMDHPENIPTEYGRYFVPYIDFREELKKFDFGSVIKVVSRAISNNQAADLMERLIQDVRPDIIHLNNIHHQLTPAILRGPVRHGIPVVWTMHDYILHCPEDNFLRDGNPCEKCARGNNIHAVIHRCKKGSLAASFLAALESTYYNRRRLTQFVDMFISPSKFLANKMTGFGMPPSQVISIPNFVTDIPGQSSAGDYFLYAGRLSHDKGVDTLIEAFDRLRRGKLIIAGDGPDRKRLEEKCSNFGLENISFIGRRTPGEILNLMGGCLAVVVPSICWDNFPYSVVEAMAAGKPVVASKTGGIPEQVDHARTGFLFEPGNVDNLTACLQKMLDQPRLAEQMGENGLKKASREYSPETHYERLMKVYAKLIDKKNSGGKIAESYPAAMSRTAE